MSTADQSPLPTNTRGRLIEGITSPIGFFVLALLIVEVFLATVLVGANLESKDKMDGVWLGVAMFILVILMVFLLVCFRPQNFVYDRQAHLDQLRMEQERLRRASGGVEMGELAGQLERTIKREMVSKELAAKLVRASEADVLGVLNEQVDRVAEEIKQSSFISVDLTAFGKDRGVLTLPVAALKTFNDLTDEIYYGLAGAVRPFASGVDWVLREKGSKRVIRTLRMLTNTPVGRPMPDTRTLDEVGIKAGMELEAVPPSAV